MSRRVFFFIMILSSLFLLNGCISVTRVFTPLEGSFFSGPVNYEITRIDPGKTKAPDHFLQILKSYLEAGLRGEGLHDSSRPANYAVDILIKRYKMRAAFVRRHIGLFSGEDGIESSVVVIDKSTGNIIGESYVTTSNIDTNTTMDDIARQHARKIGRYLSGKDQ